MEIKDIQKNELPEKRDIPISIRITKKHSEFMTKNNISPTKLFFKILEDLMKKNKK